MVYLGRVVGVGLTKQGDPMAVYAVSGRSPGSQARKLALVDNTIRTAKFIPSHFSGDDKAKCEKMWGEQEENLIYNAARVTRGRMGDDILVVTNGYQTDGIAGIFSEADYDTHEGMKELMEGILNLAGPETDPPSTPRIAGIIDPFNELYFALGIITKEGSRSVEVTPKPGKVNWVATYQKNPSTEPLIGPELDTLGMDELDMDGLTPPELAAEFMQWMDRQKDGKVEVICSAGMIYNHSGNYWNFKDCISNLWE